MGVPVEYQRTLFSRKRRRGAGTGKERGIGDGRKKTQPCKWGAKDKKEGSGAKGVALIGKNKN